MVSWYWWNGSRHRRNLGSGLWITPCPKHISKAGLFFTCCHCSPYLGQWGGTEILPFDLRADQTRVLDFYTAEGNSSPQETIPLVPQCLHSSQAAKQPGLRALKSIRHCKDRGWNLQGLLVEIPTHAVLKPCKALVCVTISLLRELDT